MNLIKFVIGDWSYDGHNMTETKTFTSNLSAKEIEDAYYAGCEIIGGNIADYLQAYEATTIPLKLVKKIEEFWHQRNPGKTEDDFLDATEFDGGYDTADYNGKLLTGEWESGYSNRPQFKPTEEYTEFVSIGTDTYFHLYLEVVRIGNPEFKMKNPDNKAQTLNVGGYGLFIS